MSSPTEGMSSNRPYLLRGLYEWISDNDLTPHILVNAEHAGVDVPQHTVQKGKVVLNIAAGATQHLHIDNDTVSFNARFSGKPHAILVPIEAVIAIYARENGQGMMFAAEESSSRPGNNGDDLDDPPPRSHLKVVK